MRSQWQERMPVILVSLATAFFCAALVLVCFRSKGELGWVLGMVSGTLLLRTLAYTR